MPDSGQKRLSAFKAYDIRGRIPDELNEEMAYKIGKAYASLLKPSRVCLGRDVRLSSADISGSVARGLNDLGCDVLDIGLCPTEEVYFATSHFKLDGGIMITASHNPMDYNGMKLVKEESRPISADTGLKDIERMVVTESFQPEVDKKGATTSISSRDAFIDHLLTYVHPEKIARLKVVMNCGNGCAGPVLDKLESRLPLEFIKIFPEPDGTFPNGIPNPILPENRGVTAESVNQHKAALGIAWDGDSDRCFFFDEKGGFIEGYYIVGLLAQAFLRRRPGSKIVHDPRLVWNTVEMVKEAGGIPVMSKAGHAFIKERMRLEDAIYGGEMSAHHYFRDFAYCDSGMIPWLLVAELLSRRRQPLAALVDARMRAFPCSGEINFRVADAPAKIREILAAYADLQPALDETDGVGLEFPDWRFNLRCSNTEPLLRLNVETRGNPELLERRTGELRALITA
jgi:phosphomannomutase